RNNDYAIRAQVIPSIDYIKKLKERKENKESSLDFMLEQDTSPIEGITRRYPMIAILKPIMTCPQICVYCQRNWEITSPNIPSSRITLKDLDKAIKWIEDHKHIMDILVTGGDPLIMNNHSIDELLKKLSGISHIKSIRIASRIPVTVPQRIDDEFINILKKYNIPGKRIIYFVTHFQDSYEISQETLKAVKKLTMNGISVYNQQVFTFSNSRRFESVALRIALKLIGIDPYYTFNMKGKEETERLHVPMARLLQEQKEEARLFSGLERTDEAVYNVPRLGKNYLRAAQHRDLIGILPDGRRVYEFHPWEKQMMLQEIFVMPDVPILSYLEKLDARGEDPLDYESIWYYY
ncbi:MAG: KamA family radical SAM protein, partial [Deltaproteobacteria bacterium]|nr:KamA family radical SAM protein [Deltaproteobacteria bacterium]